MNDEERSRGYDFQQSFAQTEHINELNDSHSMIYWFVRPDSTVLDVGCANGTMGEALHSKKSCQVWGIEYNPCSVQKALKTNAFNDIFQEDLNHFQAETLHDLLYSFDFILLGDVLEHLINPSEVMEQLKLLLKPDGHFVISLPNLAHASIKMSLLEDEFTYTDVGLLDCTHLRFFTYKSIAAFMGNAGLKVLKACGTVVPLNMKKICSFPFGSRRQILKDLHSWIFQYVMLLGQSSESHESLIAQNQKALDLSKEDLYQDIYLYNDRSHYYKAVYGSIVTNFFQFFTGKRTEK